MSTHLPFWSPSSCRAGDGRRRQQSDAGAYSPLADSPQKMLALGEDKVRDMIKTIGLFRAKAKNVVLLSKKLIDDFGGEVPATRDELETLPGVGRKNRQCGDEQRLRPPTIAVDTHLFRVSNREFHWRAARRPLAVAARARKDHPTNSNSMPIIGSFCMVDMCARRAVPSANAASFLIFVRRQTSGSDGRGRRWHPSFRKHCCILLQ